MNNIKKVRFNFLYNIIISNMLIINYFKYKLIFYSFKSKINKNYIN